jgi:hypothetical protein
MSLLEKIEQLNTEPRHQEEEYEHTSDFLEWFYYNVYRGDGANIYPVLNQIVQDPEYECIQELCRNLMNVTYTKTLEEEKLVTMNQNLKQWTLSRLQKYCQN